jgi:hypothetical protein
MKAEQRSGRRVGRIILLVGLAAIAVFIVVGVFTTHKLVTKIEIEAGPAIVWQHLTDFTSYPQWNPFITKIEGQASAGAQLSVRLQPQGQTAMDFTPTLLVVESQRELRWLGHLGVPGIFDGEHYWLIEAHSDSAVTLTQGENFSGVLALLIFAGMEEGTRSGFTAMNAALKARAEASAAMMKQGREAGDLPPGN